MLAILRSVFITACVSACVSGVFWWSGSNFANVFVTCTLIQFGVFWMFNTIIQHVTQMKMTKLENERISEYSKQSIQANCAYCATDNLIPLRLNQDNDFTCTNCGKTNAVYVGVTVTQKTTPMNMNSLDINTLNPDEQAAIDQINNARI